MIKTRTSSFNVALNKKHQFVYIYIALFILLKGNLRDIFRAAQIYIYAVGFHLVFSINTGFFRILILSNYLFEFNSSSHPTLSYFGTVVGVSDLHNTLTGCKEMFVTFKM